MLTWSEVIGQLRASRRAQAIFARALVQHPRDAGMRPSVGVPIGQRATYALRFSKREALYVYDYGTTYLAKLVEAGAAPANSIERTLRDSPGASLLGASAMGALIGLAVGHSKESALVGAIAGGVFGLAAVSLATAESSPRTSATSSDLLRMALDAMQASHRAQLDGSGPTTKTEVLPTGSKSAQRRRGKSTGAAPTRRSRKAKRRAKTVR